MTETLRGLSSVRVTKEFLLEKLQANREEHSVVYEEAMLGWNTKVLEFLESSIERVKSDLNFNPFININLPKPDNHLLDYDRAIDLLKASLDTEFVLTSKEFAQYVRDEWDWKDYFNATISGCGYIR